MYKPHKTAMLFYGYGPRNLGDMAITLGAIKLLLEEGLKVTVVSRFPRGVLDFKKSEEIFEQEFGSNVDLIACPFCLDRSASIWERMVNFAMAGAVVVGLKRPDAFHAAIKNADMVFLNGGNLLRCATYTDLTRLIALCFPLYRAKAKRKPYIILPQSSGKLNFFGRCILGPVFRHAEITFIREARSRELLQAYFPKYQFRESPDLAFQLTTGDNVLEEGGSFPKVAITVRGTGIGDLKKLDTGSAKEVRAGVTKVVTRLRNSGCDVTFVIQTVADSSITEELAESFGCPVVSFSELRSLLSFYKECDLVIGMRLHSLILAATQRTAVFGLFLPEWGLKNPGILEQIQSEYVSLGDREAVDYLSYFDFEAYVAKANFADFDKNVLDVSLLKDFKREITMAIRPDGAP